MSRMIQCPQCGSVDIPFVKIDFSKNTQVCNECGYIPYFTSISQFYFVFVICLILAFFTRVFLY